MDTFKNYILRGKEEQREKRESRKRMIMMMMIVLLLTIGCDLILFRD